MIALAWWCHFDAVSPALQFVQEAELLNAEDARVTAVVSLVKAPPAESLLPNDSPPVESRPDGSPSGSRSRSDDSESGRSNGGCSRSRSPRRRMVEQLSREFEFFLVLVALLSLRRVLRCLVMGLRARPWQGGAQPACARALA